MEKPRTLDNSAHTVRKICKKVGPEGFSDAAKKLLWTPKKDKDDN